MNVGKNICFISGNLATLECSYGVFLSTAVFYRAEEERRMRFDVAIFPSIKTGFSVKIFNIFLENFTEIFLAL